MRQDSLQDDLRVGWGQCGAFRSWVKVSTPVLIVDVIVQEFWRSHLRFTLNNLVVLAIDIGIEDGLIVRGQAVFESLLASLKIFMGECWDRKFTKLMI